MSTNSSNLTPTLNDSPSGMRLAVDDAGLDVGASGAGLRAGRASPWPGPVGQGGPRSRRRGRRSTGRVASTATVLWYSSPRGPRRAGSARAFGGAADARRPSRSSAAHRGDEDDLVALPQRRVEGRVAPVDGSGQAGALAPQAGRGRGQVPPRVLGGGAVPEGPSRPRLVPPPRAARRRASLALSYPVGASVGTGRVLVKVL